jgi:superoxide reductase
MQKGYTVTEPVQHERGQAMKRRQFLGQALTGAGAMLVAGPTLAAAKTEGFKPYEEVDSSLFQGINRPRNPQKKTPLEKKHQPVIELPKTIGKGETTKISVTVGEIEHPMSQAHYIDYVELFAGNEPAGRIKFRPRFSVPRATFYLKLDRPVTLVARANCNLHGLWESRVNVNPV